jgi:hypothetical protein
VRALARPLQLPNFQDVLLCKLVHPFVAQPNASWRRNSKGQQTPTTSSTDKSRRDKSKRELGRASMNQLFNVLQGTRLSRDTHGGSVNDEISVSMSEVATYKKDDIERSERRDASRRSASRRDASHRDAWCCICWALPRLISHGPRQLVLTRLTPRPFAWCVRSAPCGVAEPSKLQPPRMGAQYHIYCSPLNPGARELLTELVEARRPTS